MIVVGVGMMILSQIFPFHLSILGFLLTLCGGGGLYLEWSSSRDELYTDVTGEKHVVKRYKR